MADIEPTRDRLVGAVLRAWERAGSSGISARGVARDAAIPVSSIYHHFGDMDGLMLRAADTVMARAAQWFATQAQALSAATGDAWGLAHLLGATIDAWCEDQRGLAYAWREIQLQAMRASIWHGAAQTGWQLLFDFWQPICNRFGVGDMTPSVVLLFDSETSLHLVRWQRLIDRSAMAELCSTWAGWIDGRAGAPAPWRALAMREALAGQPAIPDWDPAAEQIAAAAARTVAQRGVPGLTHRAVADTAGQTLGIVSNRFRSSADLLRAACEALYREIVRPLGEGDAPMDLIADQAERPSDDLALRAFFELALAASREPALLPFAAQLRYLRGRTSIRHLRAILPPDRPPSAADGALLSSLFSGQTRARLTGAGMPPLEQGVTTMLARLSVR
ncbi:TetR/AcrR family transcriptional regulator [Sphingomonas sp. SORGH_AS_0879]|uniref:TetR/AcrR family transcriptional regulator n=1 Tax=Sphingomonas sp. SORGH_AS_0879 TaxID=3041790 RepID=UPI00277E0C6A|nr:TetR/AcrR family transcriptional regulator [Sphingomonas sp. SORGH_AS_0879]MDQ1229698.1 AcrR family transcriptional regulator [Sphingomonas sp. SORGH_AS_0879]